MPKLGEGSDVPITSLSDLEDRLLLDMWDQVATNSRAIDATTTRGFPICPVEGDTVLVDSLGVRTHSRCRTLGCFACLPWLAFGRALAIGMAWPNQTVLLTRVADEWRDSRRQVARFAAEVRKQAGRLDWAFHIEKNPGHAGNHLHGFVRNGVLEDPLVRHAATAAGLGEVAGVRAWHIDTERGPRVVKYGVKDLLSVPNDAQAIWPSAEQYLKINDGHIVHASRGFWIDADTGESFKGQRAASIAARAKWSAPRGRLIPVHRVTPRAHPQPRTPSRPHH